MWPCVTTAARRWNALPLRDKEIGRWSLVVGRSRLELISAITAVFCTINQIVILSAAKDDTTCAYGPASRKTGFCGGFCPLFPTTVRELTGAGRFKP
jgi:hypothetical protein